jgi:hypothetical protein
MSSIYTVDNPTDLIAAITAIGTGGGVIYLCPGTYTLTASLTLNSNLYVKGAGMNATIVELTGSTADVMVTSTSSPKKSLGVEHLTIKGKGTPSNYTDIQRGISVGSGYEQVRIAHCRFEDVTTGVQIAASNFCEILDCEFENIRGMPSTQGQGYGMLLENGGDHLVRGCIFRGIERHAVYLSAGCSRTVVEDNQIDTVRNDAVVVYSQANQYPADNNIIVRNTILNVTDQSDTNVGSALVLVSNVHGTNVMCNVISDCDDYGLKIETSILELNPDKMSYDHLFRGNRIREIGKNNDPVTGTSPRSAVKILNSTQNIVAQNNIGGSPAPGTSVNACVQVVNERILVISTQQYRYGTNDENTVVGNVLSGSKYGAWVDAWNGSGLRNNVFSNVCVDNTTAGYKDAGTGTIIDQRTAAASRTGVTIGAGATTDLPTITVKGAVVGDTVIVAPDLGSPAPETGLGWCGRVSATDTVTIRLSNPGTSPLTTNTRYWHVTVLQAQTLA